MAELTINTADITAALQKNLSGLDVRPGDQDGRPGARGR